VGKCAHGAQKHGGILKLYTLDSPASMSILEETTVFAQRPMMGVFNNLIMFDQHVKQNSLQSIVPDLATGWSWNEEGTELTFPLRHGVKWHDGKPFTAKDVECTWDLLSGKSSEKLRVNPRKDWYPQPRGEAIDGGRAPISRPAPRPNARVAANFGVSDRRFRFKPAGGFGGNRQAVSVQSGTPLRMGFGPGFGEPPLRDTSYLARAAARLGGPGGCRICRARGRRSRRAAPSAMPAAVLASSVCAANRLMTCAGGSAITTSSRKRSRTSASSTTRCCGRMAPRRDAQGRTHDPDAAGAAHLW